MIAEKLLGQDRGVAAIAIDAAQHPHPAGHCSKPRWRTSRRTPRPRWTPATTSRRSTAVTGLLQFPDRGHCLTIDSGWREVADRCLDWLDKQGLPGAGR